MLDRLDQSRGKMKGIEGTCQRRVFVGVICVICVCAGPRVWLSVLGAHAFSFFQMQPAAEQIAQMRRCVAVSPHYWVLLFETRVVSHCAQISPVDAYLFFFLGMIFFLLQMNRDLFNKACDVFFGVG